MTTDLDHRCGNCHCDLVARKSDASRMGDSKQIGENLVRHKSGTIYLRA